MKRVKTMIRRIERFNLRVRAYWRVLFSSILVNIAHMICRCSQLNKNLFNMNIKLTMVDADTGEILAHKYHNLACNLQTRNDAGFTKIMEWAQSCVKGVRTSSHKSIELRIGFSDELDPQWIPFNDLDKAKENAQAYVY